MDFIQSAILGLVQGLMEFIPVSSTGHLILAREIMGLDLVGTLSFDAILQLATGLAVLVYFWWDIWNIIKTLFNFIFKKPVEQKDKNILLALIIGTIPAVVLGLLLQDYMDTIFRGTTVVAITLIVGSALFYFAELYWTKVKPQSEEITLKKGLLVGLFQCLALFPGFSRSGSTISGGLLSGLNRELTIRFSFLLSLPIILGSGLYKVYDQVTHGLLDNFEAPLIIASIFAFISGLLAIHYLLKFLKNHSLNWFGLYRIILAIIILLFI